MPIDAADDADADADAEADASSNTRELHMSERTIVPWTVIFMMLKIRPMNLYDAKDQTNEK